MSAYTRQEISDGPLKKILQLHRCIDGGIACVLNLRRRDTWTDGVSKDGLGSWLLSKYPSTFDVLVCIEDASCEIREAIAGLGHELPTVGVFSVDEASNLQK